MRTIINPMFVPFIIFIIIFFTLGSTFCIIAYIITTFAYADVDECSSGMFPCDTNSNCTNTIGSFLCNCQSGYTGSGLTCEGLHRK